MVDRNRRIKTRPQRFQAETREFDVILCLEERVFDQVFVEWSVKVMKLNIYFRLLTS